MVAHAHFIHELKDAIAEGTPRRRADMLRRVTDLFIVGSASYSDAEIALFDDVITRLAVEIEVTARALLAERLAPIANAPPNIMRKLALDEEIDVAGPVLAHCERLDDPSLVQTAMKMGQEHLFAISRRRALSELVTDVLVERGDRLVVLSTAENRGARFSNGGFAMLVERSDGDDRLAASVGSRPEIPPHLFLKLLAKASQAVRSKLVAEHPQAKAEIHQVVGEVTARIHHDALERSPDYKVARAAVESLQRSGELDDKKLSAFARVGRFAETTTALATMSDLPVPFVERAMLQDRADLVLVLARAIGLSWSTVKSILLLRAARRKSPAAEIAHCLASYERMNPATAQDILRFYRRGNVPAPRTA
jgi:uncharacterized protein (DUF2336 family)